MSGHEELRCDGRGHGLGQEGFEVLVEEGRDAGAVSHRQRAAITACKQMLQERLRASTYIHTHTHTHIHKRSDCLNKLYAVNKRRTITGSLFWLVRPHAFKPTLVERQIVDLGGQCAAESQILEQTRKSLASQVVGRLRV